MASAFELANEDALSIRSGLNVPWPRRTSFGSSFRSRMISSAILINVSPIIFLFSSGDVTKLNGLSALRSNAAHTDESTPPLTRF
ncbi:hypothetical protein DERP_004522 [Dermatophagoides pteronyssinus]|uniref:Uncharacterized protein n=1 Tax=Dermatophagoides pteronyssinus TaxID=6956 RepID=A0ABQ8JP06_DERPT|nr:hypothetical protein DERP_004522 [Dermatophagoides pteronyssinus]